ncbi:hypothetical protein PO124_22450, partial [Bacillus licheniformis]|nr:hypothetical protein [Bacillus licheniformis]
FYVDGSYLGPVTNGQRLNVSTNGTYILTVHTVVKSKEQPKPEPKPEPKPRPQQPKKDNNSKSSNNKIQHLVVRQNINQIQIKRNTSLEI